MEAYLRLPPPGLDTRERLGVASSYYRVGFTPAGRMTVDRAKKVEL